MIKKKEFPISDSWITIRELTPLDYTIIPDIVGNVDENKKDSFADIALVRACLVSRDVLIDPSSKDSYDIKTKKVKVYDDESDKKIDKDIEVYIPKKDKTQKQNYEVLNNVQQIIDIQSEYSVSDWKIICSKVGELNEPNPALLGK